jgi:hypothetical protein
MAILSEVSSDEETPVVRFDRPPAVVMTGKDFLASTQDPKQPPLQLSDRAEAIIQDISVSLLPASSRFHPALTEPRDPVPDVLRYGPRHPSAI